jgi:diguanylate cyclase (GGDEF)-like protein/PAS domain S-box-containing protein
MQYPSPAGQNAIALAEGALQEQARMLSTLLGNLEGMVYRCRDDAHWTMEFVSEGCLRLTGYRPEDLLFNRRISYEDATHPEDRARVRREVHRALRENRRFDLEYRIVRADGAVRWAWERGTGVWDGQGGLLAIEGIVQDITERKQAEQAMAEAERRYRGIFENAIEGIFQTTLDGHYLAVNPALARIYGYDSPDEMMASLSDIQHQLYVEPRWRQEFLRLMQRDGVVAHFESRVYRKNGEIIWISENARAVRDEGGALLFFEGMVEDITERKRYQARLEYQAGHDALTGLPNRSLLCDRLEQSIRHARQQDGLLAVAFVDLDQFKLINDSLGHHAGDEYLKLVASRLSSCLRENDTIARQGGDEFVILLAGQNRLEAIEHIVQRLLAAIAQPWHYGDMEFHGTCSIGVSLYPKDGADSESLLKSADSAMYQAKQAGRNAVRFFTPELSAQLMQRLEMEARLRAALERQEFLLHYQPRVCLKTGALLGAEVLLRWQPPDEGLVLPGRFIALAEETGLIVPIGDWVLRAACAQAAEWRKLWPGVHLMFSVNLSPRQFRDQPLCGQVRAALEAVALPPAMLELELTENLVMHDAEGFISVLHEIKSLGVKVAIDDFGTGYSSLSYLKKFPVDRLKVDQSFVRGLGKDEEDASIVRAIIGLGHSLGLAVVAEGVETGEQLEFLRRHGCDEGQGYYFSRPLPAEAFGDLLQRQAAYAAGRWSASPCK